MKPVRGQSYNPDNGQSQKKARREGRAFLCGSGMFQCVPYSALMLATRSAATFWPSP